MCILWVGSDTERHWRRTKSLKMLCMETGEYRPILGKQSDVVKEKLL